MIAWDPMALLVGFELDQRVTVMKAFPGPLALKERLGAIDAATLASADLEPVFFEKPVIHRYPRSMAKRVHELAVYLRDHYDGDAARVWTDAPTRGAPRQPHGAARLRRDEGQDARGGPLQALRRRGRARALPGHPTLGDVDSPQALEDYQEAKRLHKAEWANQAAAGRSGAGGGASRYSSRTAGTGP